MFIFVIYGSTSANGRRIPFNDSFDERLELPERFPQKYFVQHVPLS